MEIEFPLEFIVEGVPVSLQAKRRRSIEAWKQRVLTAATSDLSEGHWATASGVALTILYFPDAPMEGDIDNIVKPILDALKPSIYLDDGQVERVWVQKFESGSVPRFLSPSSKLLEALEQEKPLIYVKVDTDLGLGDLRW